MRGPALKNQINNHLRYKPREDSVVLSRATPSFPSDHMLQRKATCACGGGCPRCQNKLPIQTKLAVSQPGDIYEQEADRVAEQVMRMPAPALQRNCGACSAGGATCASCAAEKNGLVHRKAERDRDKSGSVPDDFLHDLGPGQPLDSATRAFFEPRFGHDFSWVRVHTDARAAESAREVNALAYTVGHDVVFGAGQYAPRTCEGQRLLGHELTHVAQQSHAPNALSHRIQRQMCAPGIIIPDEATPESHQMEESEFLERGRELLNRAGQESIEAEKLDDVVVEPGLGDIYAAGLEYQSNQTGKSIETLVSESVQSCQSTAQDYLHALAEALPRAMATNRTALERMIRPSEEEAAEWLRSHEIPVKGEGGGYVIETTEAEATPSESELQSEFPEIAQPLAAGLTMLPGSIWGPLRPLLQGLIFHSIISAGYLVGKPPRAHPLAEVNRGGGTLGRRRTDLRDPDTSAVIEIKPMGDGGGVAQLASYISTLGAPWHAALDIPSEAWPITGNRARYTLNPFGINFTLEAWNQFATEAGMLYYQLVVTPGIPVYVPRHAPQPERRFHFEIPRIVLPELRLPALPPEAVAAMAATAGGLLLLFAAATLIPGIPPPP